MKRIEITSGVLLGVYEVVQYINQLINKFEDGLQVLRQKDAFQPSREDERTGAGGQLDGGEKQIELETYQLTRQIACWILLINYELYSLYASSQNYYYTREINEILSSQRTQATVRFRDSMCYDETEEYLKRVYLSPEFPQKSKVLSEFYKYHKDLPRWRIAKSFINILNDLYDRKRKLEYYRVQRLIERENDNNPNHPPKGIVGARPITSSSSDDPSSSSENLNPLPVSNILVDISCLHLKQVSEIEVNQEKQTETDIQQFVDLIHFPKKNKSKSRSPQYYRQNKAIQDLIQKQKQDCMKNFNFKKPKNNNFKKNLKLDSLTLQQSNLDLLHKQPLSARYSNIKRDSIERILKGKEKVYINQNVANRNKAAAQTSRPTKKAVSEQQNFFQSPRNTAQKMKQESRSKSKEKAGSKYKEKGSETNRSGHRNDIERLKFKVMKELNQKYTKLFSYDSQSMRKMLQKQQHAKNLRQKSNVRSSETSKSRSKGANSQSPQQKANSYQKKKVATLKKAKKSSPIKDYFSVITNNLSKNRKQVPTLNLKFAKLPPGTSVSSLSSRNTSIPQHVISPTWRQTNRNPEAKKDKPK